MKVVWPISLIFILSLGILVSCNDEENPIITDSFDRGTMLEDWADLIIIPAFTTYQEKLNALQAAQNSFQVEATVSSLQSLREAYLSAYKAWQGVAMFDIGKAEQIGLRNYTNIFPTDVESIEENVASQIYNLELPSTWAVQGFPALDYLLFGLSESADEVLSLLESSGYSLYLEALVFRLVHISGEVITDWQGAYRESFITNDGASATASVDKMVNDYLFYYERFLRAGKIGIPAGVFSGNTLPESVEAYHSNIYSKELFLESLDAVEDFFLGISHDGNTQGQSLESYLIHRANEAMTANVAPDILMQFDLARTRASALTDSFSEQVISDNSKLLETYDELQKAVVLMKVDMMQAFNIQVDYVDADGD